MKISIVLASLVFAACTTAPSDDEPAVTDGAEQQVGTAAGKGDASGAKSTDPRLVNCHLEYQSITPAWAVRAAGTFDTTFGTIENQGGATGDGAYTLTVSTNPAPPYNLSFFAAIWDAHTNKQLSYIVLPRPHVGGAFLFELGAQIPATTFDGSTQAFDTLRAYCSIRMPS